MKLIKKLQNKMYMRTMPNNPERITKSSKTNNLHIENMIKKNVTVIGNRPDKVQFQTLLLLLILVFSGIAMCLVKTNSMNNSSLQKGIAEDIIRFHVIANSDSTQDQALKLTVKNTLVKSLSPFLQDSDTIDDARKILSDKLSYIQEVAEETILQNGYHYSVAVSLENCYFPLKVYGDYTFPPGTYEALRVQIGEAEGKNWWCVMFPPLCFVEETYSIVDTDSQTKLKHLLTEEEYDTLIDQKTPIKIKFKLWEELKKLFI
ncbi:MAG: stage II sporulation protein R [Mobilitalea sp.]